MLVGYDLYGGIGRRLGEIGGLGLGRCHGGRFCDTKPGRFVCCIEGTICSGIGTPVRNGLIGVCGLSKLYGGREDVGGEDSSPSYSFGTGWASEILGGPRLLILVAECLRVGCVLACTFTLPFNSLTIPVIMS